MPCVSPHGSPAWTLRRQLLGLLVLAEEAEHRAREVRERVEVVDLLEDRAIDDRRERVDLGAVVLGELR